MTDEKPTSETKVKQSKQREEDHKHNVLPQGSTSGPGVNRKSETMANADTDRTMSEKAIDQSHPQLQLNST